MVNHKQTTDFSKLERDYDRVEVEDVKVLYQKPGLVQMPYVTQWLIQGFAPSFLSQEQLDDMNTNEQLNEALKYVRELNDSTLPEEQRDSIWGGALITSEASIRFLYPCLETCFPEINIYKVKDTVLNQLMTLFFTDFFNLIADNK